MSPDPVAVRVAHRHARDAAIVVRDVPQRTRIEFTWDGRISALWVRTWLEPILGPLGTLRFCPSPDGPPTTVVWEALSTDRAEVLTGTLVLRAKVMVDAVETWAEVTIDP